MDKVSVEDLRNRILKTSENADHKSDAPLLTSFFTTMDLDHSRSIEFNEFKNGLSLLGLSNISEKEKVKLFQKFDKNECGKIFFDDFVATLKPPLSDCRIKVIDAAFKKLDVNKDGVLTIEDFRQLYDQQASMHPKYLCGKWSKDEVRNN